MGHKVQLRSWQAQALTAWEAQSAGVIQAVTGSGKTYLAIAAIEVARRRWDSLNVFVSVPSIALMDQWEVELRETLDPPIDGLVRYVGGEILGHGSIHVGVMHTLAQKIASVVDPRRPSLLIADECHRLGAPAFRAILSVPWTATLGLSATPRRQYDNYFESHVEPGLGPIIFEYGYDAALRDGVISDFVLENYRIPVTIASRAGDPLAGLRETILIAERHLPNRMIIFHESIDAADAIGDLLTRRGFRADVYHSRRSHAARLRALSLFRSQQLDVLVTCRALDEGLNVPDVSVGVIAAGTSSRRQRIQRMGRALRTSEKDFATICTIYSSDDERSRLEAEATSLRECRAVKWFFLNE